MSLHGPLLPRTHVAACPHSAKADASSQPDRQPAPADLQIRSSYNERDREHQERELNEGNEAIALEIAERNRRNGWSER
jgi:hypothetical protein